MHEIMGIILNATIVLWVKKHTTVCDKQMLIIKYELPQMRAENLKILFTFLQMLSFLLHPEW